MFRRSEWVLIAYLIYTAAVAVVRPVSPAVRTVTLACNAGVLACYALVGYAGRLRKSLLLSVARDWFPLILLLLAYREMGWFALPHQGHALEQSWVVWDRMVLRGGGRAAIESLGPVLPSLLEVCYSLVYALGPFAVVMLYVYRRRGRVDTFLVMLAVGVLLCYAQFPLWPSEPPRTVFPGQDFPSYDTVFRRFNWWLLGGYGMHTSVFPSAHVAGAFSAAIGMRRALPERPWVWRLLLVMAVLIATATVYGRYHYLADATAGLAMALVAAGVTRWLATYRLRKKKA
ncbi:MAG TPA: phosphatase PAP2 family protein [Bryobacteraceae bacterium]|nr:phosphatase PAP2 family protein [Bryobacteraceae bacterium]